MGVVLGPLHLPGRLVQYYSANLSLLWSSSYFAFGFPLGGQGDDTFRSLRPRPQTVDWNRYPLHPQRNYSAGGIGALLFPLFPSAFRAGNTLTLTYGDPFSDNTPGHRGPGTTGPGGKIITRYEIDQNGKRIAGGTVDGEIPLVTLSRTRSVIRFTLDGSRRGPSYKLSTSNQTVWTWPSRRQPGAILPKSWVCGYVFIAGRQTPERRCAVQPLMTMDYQVRGLALNGTAPPGRQLIGLHVGHLQLAAAARVTGAAAQMSCDGGRNWNRAAVTSAHRGNFRITFRAPAGCLVTLRVRAADTAGDSISETIQRAYKITGTGRRHR